MSTADICILTASANGSRDLYQRYINPQVTARQLFRLSIGLAILIGISASLMAWKMQDIIDILLMAFTINSAALFVPTIAMVTTKGNNSSAAFWSILLALTTVITWYIASWLDLAPLFGLDPLWPGLLVSFCVFTALHLVPDRPIPLPNATK